MFNRRYCITIVALIALIMVSDSITFADHFSINPKSGTLTTVREEHPSAEYIKQNKADILEKLEKVKPINLVEPGVIVNSVPLSLKLAVLDIELGVAVYTGTAKRVLDGNMFPNVSKDRAQDIISGKVDLRKDVTTEVIDRMIMQELYWQEAQKRGFDVGETKAREYARSEYNKLKDLKTLIHNFIKLTCHILKLSWKCLI